MLALRTLGRSPGFTAVALLTLTLGIGASTAVFSLVSAVLFRPLPYPDPERVVRLYGSRAQEERDAFSVPNYRDVRDRVTSFSAVAAWRSDRFSLARDDRTVGLDGQRVTDLFFDVYGVPPAFGRTFGAGEGRRSGPGLAVLAHAVWRDHFGGAADVVGRTIQLNRRATVIVGVMPGGFRDAEGSEIWVLDGEMPYPPFGAEDRSFDERNFNYLSVIGRVKPWLTMEAARDEVAAVGAALASEHPDANRDRQLRVVDVHEDLVGTTLRPGLVLLATAVGLVLLIACANVANLLLARGTARQKELAIRYALGAGRRRLALLLVVESLVLSSVAAVLAVLLTSWTLDTLVALSPVVLPPGMEPGIDWRVGTFAAALAIVSGALFGVIPAFQTTSALDAALHDGARASGSGATSRTRAVLVVVETALAISLVTGAALVAKSFVRLASIEHGFDPRGVLTVRLPLPLPEYANPERQQTLYRDVLDQLRGTSGIKAAAIAFPLPLAPGGDASATLVLEGRSHDEALAVVGINWVSPDYFQAMRIQVHGGRVFDDRDGSSTPLVAIVNQRAVDRYFDGKSPLGRRLKLGSEEAPWLSVVGIVGDVSGAAAASPPDPEVYVPIFQQPFPYGSVLVRGAGDPLALAPAVRDAVAAADPQVTIGRMRSLEGVISDSLADSRFRTWMLGLFSGLAMLLAGIGLYGVMTYTVGQRTGEFGLRMALGASRRDVSALVLRFAARLMIPGLVVGLLLALAGGRLLQATLFGVEPSDPLVLSGVTLTLVMVSVLAAIVPAWRATRVDPVLVLRGE